MRLCSKGVVEVGLGGWGERRERVSGCLVWQRGSAV